MKYTIPLHFYFTTFALLVLLIASIALVFANGWPLLVVKGRGFYVVPTWVKVVFFIALLTVLYLGLQRDTYLPFLGETVLPPTLLKADAVPENANTQAVIDIHWAKDGTKVLYWAASPAKEVVSTPQQAYGSFSNAGIATLKDGKAILKFECPSKYNVGAFEKTLNKHVHYRIVKENGMLGRVKTAWVECQ
jgi:hypothetical protein